MGFDARALGQLEHRVVGEIALPDGTAFDVDAAIQCCCQPEDHTAFHLLRHDAGVDDDADVGRTHHAVHPRLAGDERHFDHFGHDAAKALVQCHAAGELAACCGALARPWRTPTGFLGGEPEHGGVARPALQQRQAKRHRVLPGFGSQLIDEALREKRIVRMAYGAPVAHRHATARGHMRHALVRDGIGQVEQAFANGFVGHVQRPGQHWNAALHVSRLHGVARAGDLQARRLALCVEAGLHHGHASRAVEVMGDVFFAWPHQLHRPAAGVHGHPHSLADEVHFQAAAEAATEVGHVHGDSAFGHTRHARGDGPRQPGHLGRRPDLDPPIGDPCGAVDRLHGRMRQIGRAVHLLDPARCGFFRGLHVTAGVEGEAALALRRLAGLPLQGLGDGLRIQGAGGALLPFDGQCLCALPGMPVGAADHGHGRCGAGVAAQPHDPLDTGQPHGCFDVDPARAAAQHRAVPHHRESEFGKAHVDAEHGRAISLRRSINARRRGADQLPLRGVLDLDHAGRRGGGKLCQHAEMGLLPRRVADHTVRHS